MEFWLNLISTPLQTIPNPFDRALARETMRSERLRMGVITLLFLIALAFYLLVISNLAHLATEAAGHSLLSTWLVLFYGVSISYEGLIYGVMGYLILQERQLAQSIRYFNVFIETSFATVIMALSTQLVGPISALASPASLIYFFFIVLATLRLDWRLCVFTGVVAAVEYSAMALTILPLVPADRTSLALLAPWFYVSKSIVLLASGGLAGFVSRELRGQFLRSVQAAQEQSRVVEMFGQYVSPTVVDKLLTQTLTAEGEIRYVCIMFLDIRDFSRYSEKRDPVEVVRYLNQLFEFMVDSINRHQGFVNKFLGDGFMAVFGAPLPDGRAAQNAVAAAHEILAQAAELAAQGHIPPTRLGIGLHAGEAVTGNVGSAARKEYTIIGDVVNLAARLEQLNKTFDSQLLVSAAVWQALAEGAHPGEALGTVDVKGFIEPVQVYRLQ